MDFDKLISVWWQPDTPDHEYMGQISREPDGATAIELAGTLTGSPFPMHDPEPQVLHGLGKKGPLFTARKVTRSGAGMGMPGFATEVLRPLSLIVGAHVDESTRYDQALLQATFLSDWLQESGIQVAVQPSTDAESGSVAVSYQWPKYRPQQRNRPAHCSQPIGYASHRRQSGA